LIGTVAANAPVFSVTADALIQVGISTESTTAPQASAYGNGNAYANVNTVGSVVPTVSLTATALIQVQIATATAVVPEVSAYAVSTAPEARRLYVYEEIREIYVPLESRVLYMGNDGEIWRVSNG
jgi:hypothetical protein